MLMMLPIRGAMRGEWCRRGVGIEVDWAFAESPQNKKSKMQSEDCGRLSEDEDQQRQKN